MVGRGGSHCLERNLWSSERMNPIRQWYWLLKLWLGLWGREEVSHAEPWSLLLALPLSAEVRVSHMDRRQLSEGSLTHPVIGTVLPSVQIGSSEGPALTARPHKGRMTGSPPTHMVRNKSIPIGNGWGLLKLRGKFWGLVR